MSLENVDVVEGEGWVTEPWVVEPDGEPAIVEERCLGRLALLEVEVVGSHGEDDCLGKLRITSARADSGTSGGCPSVPDSGTEESEAHSPPLLFPVLLLVLAMAVSVSVEEEPLLALLLFILEFWWWWLW